MGWTWRGGRSPKSWGAGSRIGAGVFARAGAGDDRARGRRDVALAPPCGWLCAVEPGTARGGRDATADVRAGYEPGHRDSIDIDSRGFGNRDWEFSSVPGSNQRTGLADR